MNDAKAEDLVECPDCGSETMRGVVEKFGMCAKCVDDEANGQGRVE
jgi:ribosomal protein L37AE/L43A